jgi:hypothetical protein
VITYEGKNAALAALIRKDLDEKNPFTEIEGRSVMRFDRLEIQRDGKDSYGREQCVIRFSFKGGPTAYEMHISGDLGDPNQSAVLAGFDGMMGITIEC